MRITLCATLLFAACGSGPVNGPAPDMTMAAKQDMATMPTEDMATVPTEDMATMPADDMSTAGDAAQPKMFTLKVDNYLSWCSVSVNGGAANTIQTQTFMFPAGKTVNLTGDKANNVFVWGYWYGTSGDVGPMHDTKMATTVVMTADKIIQACCPFANMPNTPCPAPM